MAHEFESGFVASSKPAWHGLATVLDDAPSVAEGIRLAGLDWRVEEVPLFIPSGSEGEQDPEYVGCTMTTDGRGTRVDKVGYDVKKFDCSDLNHVSGHKVLRRETDGSILGVVSNKYTPLQNADAFKFFDPFIESGQATLESAGSLKGGKRVWILAKVKGLEGEVVPGDEVQAHLLLSNGHDGFNAVRVMFTPIRVVCWNTLSAAETTGEMTKSCIRIKHMGNIKEALEVVQNSIDFAQKTFTMTLTQYREMSRKGMNIDGFKRYVRKVLNVPEEEDRMPRAWEALEYSFENGPGATMNGVYGTVWGGYCALTDWVDHTRGSNEASRLDATWFSTGAEVRRKAQKEAVTLLTD